MTCVFIYDSCEKKNYFTRIEDDMSVDDRLFNLLETKRKEKQIIFFPSFEIKKKKKNIYS